jgi:hypothetical protein
MARQEFDPRRRRCVICLRCDEDFLSIDPARQRICPNCERLNKPLGRIASQGLPDLVEADGDDTPQEDGHGPDG